MAIHPVESGDESRRRLLQVFAPILWSALKLDTISLGDCSRRSEPVTWIGHNFRTHSLLLYDVISEVVLTNSLR